MLKHIVMWKFTDGCGNTKDENVEIARSGLEALTESVPTLKKITFIKNAVECDRNFDALLIVETENEADLNPVFPSVLASVLLLSPRLQM